MAKKISPAPSNKWSFILQQTTLKPDQVVSTFLALIGVDAYGVLRNYLLATEYEAMCEKGYVHQQQFRYTGRRRDHLPQSEPK